MEKIFSKVDTKKLLHIITRKEDIIPGRIDIVPEDNFIQCSMLNLENNKTFKPHKHIWKERTKNVIAQESWVVIQGSVKCILYDIDDTIIAESILKPGDASFTLEGGHNYLILEDNTLVYEYKTGPYEGQTFDKTFID
jgi:cupin fold WbuC family metalloprotein